VIGNAFAGAVDAVENPVLVDVASVGDSDGLDDLAAAENTAVAAVVVVVDAVEEQYCEYY